MLLSLINFNLAKNTTSSNEKKKFTKEANMHVINAYKLDPRNSLCTIEMAKKFLQKDLHKANVMAQSSLLHTDSPELKAEAMAIAGRISHSQGDYEKAFEQFQIAVKHNPHSAVLQFSLAQIYIFKGDIENACICLENVLAKHPNDYDTLKVMPFNQSCCFLYIPKHPLRLKRHNRFWKVSRNC